MILNTIFSFSHFCLCISSLKPHVLLSPTAIYIWRSSRFCWLIMSSFIKVAQDNFSGFLVIQDKIRPDHGSVHVKFYVTKKPTLTIHQSRLLTTLNKRSLLKTLWDKEKMLVTSIFSLSHNVFNPFKNKVQVLSSIYIVLCKMFQVV